MKHLLLFLFVLSISCLKLYAQTSDSSLTRKDSLKESYKNFLTEVQSIRSETKQTVTTLLSSLDTVEINTNIKMKQVDDRIKQAENKIVSLEKDVRTLQSIDSVNNLSKKQILKKRFELATKTILPGMIRGVTFVTTLTDFIGIEQKIEIETNIWQDVDFRDGYDKIKDWTAIFGIGGAIIPMFANENINPKTALLTSIGAMIVPQLISWIGKKSQDSVEKVSTKILSKVEFINVSRHAYDDLYQRNLEITKIYEMDTMLLSSLESLKKFIEQNPSITDTLMSFKIFEVQEHLNKFTEIQNQIPKYLLWTKDMISKYKSYDKVYSKINLIENKIEKFLKDYKKAFDTISDIPVEVRKELFMPAE
ncbi:MAG: hypothetical protein JST20_12060 [Bacteroidetes bacterium]|nr:hypothetical protein [Bacteroidota bacterium]